MRTASPTVGTLLLVLAEILGTGCDEPTGSQPGSILIAATTLGEDLDPDGYQIDVDNGPPTIVGTNDSVVVDGVPPGTRTVRLSEAAANCGVADAEQRSVRVIAGDTARLDFSLVCRARVGTLLVEVITTGVELDTSGYWLALDTLRVHVGPNDGAVALTIREGTHALSLDDVAPNCAVSQSSRPVQIAFDVISTITFHVACAQTFGSIRVVSVTTGSDLPNGYLTILDDACTPTWADDCSDPPNHRALGANHSVTFAAPSGPHEVHLHDVAPNCALVGDRTRSVDVTADDTAEVTYSIACAALGRVQVVSSMLGADLDADGFVMYLTGTAPYAATLSGNGQIQLSVAPGTYTLTIAQLAVNCDLLGGDTRTVTVGSGVTVTAAIDVRCATAPYLAYVSDADGNAEIYSIKMNGAEQRRLTTNAAVDEDPDWSSTSRIAFTSTRNGNRNVFVMNADGSGQVALTSAAQDDYDPAWAPDGSRIAFVSERDGNPEIYVMNADGTNPVRLTNNSAAETQPAWSPDGSRIAFRSDRTGTGSIFVINADGSGTLQLTPSGHDARDPAWSPDGLTIAFSRAYLSSCSADDCPYNVFLLKADGSGSPSQVSMEDARNADWSVFGDRLLFERVSCLDWSPCTREIASFRRDGTGLGIFAAGRNPSWKP